MPSKPAAMLQIRVGERMFTLNERRAGACRVGKGEVVQRYFEPLPTKEMRHHTAFPKGKIDPHFNEIKISPVVIFDASFETIEILCYH
jgi:hypothetical protein